MEIPVPWKGFWGSTADFATGFGYDSISVTYVSTTHASIVNIIHKNGTIRSSGVWGAIASQKMGTPNEKPTRNLFYFRLWRLNPGTWTIVFLIPRNMFLVHFFLSDYFWSIVFNIF